MCLVAIKLGYLMNQVYIDCYC